MKREANYNNWKLSRARLAEAAMARQAPPDPQPCAANGCGSEGVVRCLTCSLAGEIVCTEHDQRLHNTAHCHVRQHWQQGYLQKLAPHRFLVPLGEPLAPVHDAAQEAAGQPLAAAVAYAPQGAVESRFLILMLAGCTPNCLY